MRPATGREVKVYARAEGENGSGGGDWKDGIRLCIFAAYAHVVVGMAALGGVLYVERDCHHLLTCIPKQTRSGWYKGTRWCGCISAHARGTDLGINDFALSS